MSPPSHEAGSRLQADLRNCARLKKTNTKEKKRKKKLKMAIYTVVLVSKRQTPIGKVVEANTKTRTRQAYTLFVLVSKRQKERQR